MAAADALRNEYRAIGRRRLHPAAGRSRSGHGLESTGLPRSEISSNSRTYHCANADETRPALVNQSIPAHGQTGIVQLQDEARVDDGAIFMRSASAAAITKAWSLG